MIFVAGLALVAVQVVREAAPARPWPLQIDCYVILAREAPGAMDSRLGHLVDLREPPFDAYPTMELLAFEQWTVLAGHAVESSLPNGRVLRVVADPLVEDGAHRLHVSVNRPGDADYLVSSTVVRGYAEPFFYAGQRHDGGVLVIALELVRREE